jgi:hypothetical protein
MIDTRIKIYLDYIHNLFEYNLAKLEKPEDEKIKKAWHFISLQKKILDEPEELQKEVNPEIQEKINFFLNESERFL